MGEVTDDVYWVEWEDIEMMCTFTEEFPTLQEARFFADSLIDDHIAHRVDIR